MGNPNRDESEPNITGRPGTRVFPVTQWTLVAAAGATPSPESAAALERLGATYGYPL